MDSQIIRIDLEKPDDIIDLEVLSDEHYGDPKRDKELCLRREKAILNEPNRYTAFGGDMFNNIMPWDKRWTLESSAYNSLQLEIEEWEQAHYELFEMNKTYIKEVGWPKIWYGLAGNHEYMDKEIDHYRMKSIFDRHQIKYLGSNGMVGLEVSHKGKLMHRWTIAVAHGFGSSKTLEKPLLDFSRYRYADVFLQGHLHRKFITQVIAYDFNFDVGEYVERKVVLGNTGTLTNSIIRGRDSWFEHRNEWVHSAPGTITISFDAYKKDIDYHG